MSLDLQSTVKLLRLNDYTSLIVITAVVYDYLLTFSREIDYIWCRPWTWVTAMFVLLRYVGLSWTILNGLVGRTFIPGPLLTCTAMFLVTVWEIPIFLNIGDLVMILRVHAMWNRSKRILWILLFFYVPQIIVSFVLRGIYNNPNTHFIVTIDRVADRSVCGTTKKNVPSMLSMYVAIPRFIIGTTLLGLAVIQTLKQSVEMYKVTKRWQPNRYMQQLVRDGIIYFIVNALFHITFLIQSQVTTTVNNTSIIFLDLFCYITICPMMPRFIISVRELYECDSWDGVDTGFGVSSQPMIESEDTVTSPIVFADGVLGLGQIMEEDADELEAIRYGVVEGGACQV